MFLFLFFKQKTAYEMRISDWSSDVCSSDLSCKVPSPKGTGNTGFSNTYAAYDALSAEDKARYEDLKVLHGPWASLFYYEPEPSLAKLKIMQGIGETVLPLVWETKSGRKSLVLGCDRKSAG